MEPRSYDVVLLPEDTLSKEAIRLSESLEECGVYFTLGHKTLLPHLSLYMLQLDELGLRKTFDLLSTVADENSIIEATADHYHHEDGYVDVGYVKSKELVGLQKKVIDKLNPIRAGMRDKDKARLADATGETRSNLIDYGHRNVGSLFRPHLTFARFKESQEHIIDTLPPKETFSGTYPLLELFEMGEHGTCTRKVKTWRL